MPATLAARELLIHFHRCKTLLVAMRASACRPPHQLSQREIGIDADGAPPEPAHINEGARWRLA